MRASAASRSPGAREPVASATTATSRPASSSPSTVCNTQTCASQPATTIRCPGAICLASPVSGHASKRDFASTASPGCGARSGTMWPSLSGICSV